MEHSILFCMSKEKEAWLKNLAKNIKSLRKEKGMSQQALAEKLGS